MLLIQFIIYIQQWHYKDLIINYAYNYVYISRFYHLYSKRTWLDYSLQALCIILLYFSRLHESPSVFRAMTV